MLLSFVLCLFMSALSSCCILFVILSFHGALIPCNASYSLCFYQVVPFSYCSFFFSCRTYFIFSSFFPCWSLFMFNYFHTPLFYVALFSCCVLPYDFFSCLKSIYFGLFHIGALFLYFRSFDVTLILSRTFTWFIIFRLNFFHVFNTMRCSIYTLSMFVY